MQLTKKNKVAAAGAEKWYRLLDHKHSADTKHEKRISPINTSKKYEQILQMEHLRRLQDLST
jgi:hypothetical protein